MAEPVTDRAHPGGSSPSPPSAMVELHAVRRSFVRPGGGRVVALSIAELTVPRGSLCGLVGPNGSGKSTLLHLVSGLLRPDSGTIRVGGVDLRALTEPALDRFRARNVGYLLQGGQLMDCLTAEENVMAASLFAGLPGAGQRSRAEALLRQLGVQHRARHRPSTLSGGERQRVALARALVNEPPLLLADEPLASLDRAGAVAMATLLRSLVRERGLTVLVATHQPERLEPDLVVELEAERGGA
jgi:putative ABC transport system ATP-binding protein